ncbi:hypothetical protein DPMN_154440 [Dreissena polymorpha]|uniref:Uncharacterized protein n=1 Tax=Dreissena polymorpha TaxID=45954 RepID=A0A9D4JAD1_DREPO|nr:hypothetical protein DPMN_154440 [Dreissena polymorpha]
MFSWPSFDSRDRKFQFHGFCGLDIYQTRQLSVEDVYSKYIWYNPEFSVLDLDLDGARKISARPTTGTFLPGCPT